MWECILEKIFIPILISVTSSLATIVIKHLIDKHKQKKKILTEIVLFYQTIPNMKISKENREIIFYKLISFNTTFELSNFSKCINKVYSKIYNTAISAISSNYNFTFNQNIFYENGTDLLEELKNYI